MSETKWTRGPWIMSSYGWNVLTGDSWNSICQLKGGAEWEDRRGYYVQQYEWQNQEANARLIAAAPELYEALNTLLNAPALSKVEGIVAGWNGPPDNPYSPHPPQLGARIETTCGRVYELDKAMKNARAALAKARGE